MGTDPASLGLNVTVDQETGCWIWPGPLFDGYGQAGRRLAHVYVWEFLRDALPQRVQLDHMCRNRACVRPEHMDPVSGAENMRRTFRRYRESLERCPEGHRLDDHGLKTKFGGIVCKICCNL